MLYSRVKVPIFHAVISFFRLKELINWHVRFMTIH